MPEFEIIEERLYSHTVDAETLKHAIAAVENSTNKGTFLGCSYRDSESDEPRFGSDDVTDRDCEECGNIEVERFGHRVWCPVPEQEEADAQKATQQPKGDDDV